MASPHGQAPTPRPVATTPGGATSGTGSTQIFGGGKSPMMSTQIFGSGPHAKPQVEGTAPAPVPDTTLAFGAAQGAEKPGSSTPPPPSVAPVGVTRTFGAVGPQPGNATQTFGAVPAHGASVGNATQTFGAVPAHGAGTAGSATFGAGASHGTVPGNATQTFGAVSSGTTPGDATQPFGAVRSPGNATQPFGATSSRASTAPGNTTQAFGAVPAHDAPAPIGKTQAYGAVTANEAPVGSAPSGPGALAASASSIFPPRGSHAAGNTTQAFGAVPAIPPVVTTQAYGAVSAEPAGQGASARTGASGDAPGLQLPPEPVGSETLLPFGPNAQGPAAVEPVAGPGSPSRREAVQLPPELLAAARSPSSPGMSIETGSTPGGRERLWLILVIAAGLVLAAVLAYPAWRDRNADMPAAAVEDKDRAAALLRRDDTASREQAIQRLRTLTASHPRYVEAQAELAVAVTLRLSDLQADADRLQARADTLNREKLAARDALDPVERQQRLATLDRDLAFVTEELAPVRGEADMLRQDLYTQITALSAAPEVEPAPAVAARLKARALHAAVTVSPDALALAERLRNAEGSNKTWSTLARAEYALSSGSPPDSLVEVAKELDALRQEDRTLLRAYVLGARLALRLNDPATARSLLDDVLALNPNHQLASKLLAQVDASTEQP